MVKLQPVWAKQHFSFHRIFTDTEFGAVKYIEAKLNDEIEGAIVFPAKTTHDENYLEFIAEMKLRDELNIEDGDVVSLEF